MPAPSRLLAGAALALAAVAVPAPAQQVDFNTGLTPPALTSGLTGIAWLFRPSTTLVVAGVRTWFSGAAGGADRDVTFEVRGADVNGPALRSVVFGSAGARSGLGGADFGSAITLVAGQDYWLTFLGIEGLGRNAIDAPFPPGATALAVSIRRPIDATFVAGPPAGSAPILRLTAVPEPGTSALLVTGLGALAALARRRRPAGAA